MLDLPKLVTWESVDWTSLDAVFLRVAARHDAGDHRGGAEGQSEDQDPRHVRRFPAARRATYAEWYGHEHQAPELQKEAVYGLTELYRDDITKARLVACPGCYPTATLLALVPVAKAGLIHAEDIIVDAKSGVTGAGRGLKQNTLFSEAGEGLSPYSIGKHRHAPEIEQEIGVAVGGRSPSTSRPTSSRWRAASSAPPM